MIAENCTQKMIKIADFSKTVSSDDNAHRDSDDSEPEMFMPRPEPQGQSLHSSIQVFRFRAFWAGAELVGLLRFLLLLKTVSTKIIDYLSYECRHMFMVHFYFGILQPWIRLSSRDAEPPSQKCAAKKEAASQHCFHKFRQIQF